MGILGTKKRGLLEMGIDRERQNGAFNATRSLVLTEYLCLSQGHISQLTIVPDPSAILQHCGKRLFFVSIQFNSEDCTSHEQY